MTGPTTMLPTLKEASAPFWQAGQENILKFLRCTQCGLYLHPPAPVCRKCFGRDASWQAVRGFGTIVSFTVPVASPPELQPAGSVAIAIVELDEQPDLNLTTAIVGCEREKVLIGARVRVCFRHNDDVYLPMFELTT